MMKPLIITALLASVPATAAAQEARGIWGPNKHEAMIQPVVRSPDLPEAQRVTLTCAVPKPALGQTEAERCTFLREEIPQAFDPAASETLITCVSFKPRAVPGAPPANDRMMCGFYLDGNVPSSRRIPGAEHPPFPDRLYPVTKPF